jgi:hypothetical protein
MVAETGFLEGVEGTLFALSVATNAVFLDAGADFLAGAGLDFTGSDFLAGAFLAAGRVVFFMVG